MFRLIRSRVASAPRIATDKVIRLHHLDDTFQNRLYAGRFLLRFNDVLDPDKLRSSLQELLEMDGWRKVGARLRSNTKGELEYHIPASYTADRPAIRFSQVKHDMPIGRHILASKLPSGVPTKRPAVVVDPTQFLPLTGGPEYPQQLDDYLDSDEPQIGLHVASFSDATIVSLSASHTLFDLGGRKELLQAWSLVMRGRKDQVKPLHGYDSDPLAVLGDGVSREPYKLESSVMTGWRGHFVALRFLLQKLYAGEETRVVCVPAAYVQELCQRARSEQRAGGSIFLSEGDVLSAWLARHVCATAPLVAAFPARTVRLGSAYGLRPVLGRDHDLLPASKAYLGNAFDVVYALMAARDMVSKPLGQIAGSIRRSIQEQGTREQIEAIHDLHNRTGGMAWVGSLFMYMIWTSNLSNAKLHEVDFSPAVVSRGMSIVTEPPSPTNNKPGRPVYFQTMPIMQHFPKRNQLVIYGKTMGGDYWLSGCLKRGAWAKIDRAMEEEWRDFSGAK